MIVAGWEGETGKGGEHSLPFIDGKASSFIQRGIGPLSPFVGVGGHLWMFVSTGCGFLMVLLDP